MGKKKNTKKFVVETVDKPYTFDTREEAEDFVSRTPGAGVIKEA